MTEHSPGPWEVSINPDWQPHHKWAVSREITIRPTGEHPHGLWIADCGLSVNDENMANARLIAAAPDLLNVCENGINDVQQVLDSWAKGDLAGAVNRLEAWQESARAAIAHAKGD